MAKSNIKAVSNQEIIAALLQHGTVKAAAAAVATTPRTIYDRFQSPDFRSEYMEAKNDLVRKAVFSINEKLGAAVDAVAGIMNDSEVNAAVRLQAAQTILSNAAKFANRLNEDENRSRTEVYNSERELKEQAEWDKMFYGA